MAFVLSSVTLWCHTQCAHNCIDHIVVLWRNYGRDLEKTEKFTELYQRIITKRASVGAKKYLNCNYSWVVVIAWDVIYV